MCESIIRKVRHKTYRKILQVFTRRSIFLLILSLVLADEGMAQGEWFSSPTARFADCRYAAVTDDPGTSQNDSFHSVGLPDDDVFRPLLAAPKEPRFLGAYQRVRFRNAGESLNVGLISAGGTFGLWALRHKSNCDGVQFSLFGAIFSQFNLDADSTDLINSDFQVGFPLTWRRGPYSTRLRVYHQSSHVGDEFLLRNPGFNRVNLGFEAMDVLISFESHRWRLYSGGSYLIRRKPALKRSVVQLGVEFRSRTHPSPILGKLMEGVYFTPVFGADVQSLQHFDWNVNTSVMGGLEWSRQESTRRFRILLNYYRGHNPYGQFFDQKIQVFGIGLYIEI